MNAGDWLEIPAARPGGSVVEATEEFRAVFRFSAMKAVAVGVGGVVHVLVCAFVRFCM